MCSVNVVRFSKPGHPFYSSNFLSLPSVKEIPDGERGSTISIM
jgi:hypothetical protein